MPAFDQQLGSAAVDVAWRFDAYSSYGQNRATALRALRRRAPGYDNDRCERAFEAALQLCRNCKRVVAENREHINYRGNGDLSPFRRHLSPHLREFGEREVDGMTAMVIYYFHLR